jgi:hypothetical protein
VAGRLTEVAAAAQEFKALKVQAEHLDQWFLPQLVGELLDDEAKIAFLNFEQLALYHHGERITIKNGLGGRLIVEPSTQ